jgi:hypothetical protein
MGDGQETAASLKWWGDLLRGQPAAPGGDTTIRCTRLVERRRRLLRYTLFCADRPTSGRPARCPRCRDGAPGGWPRRRSIRPPSPRRSRSTPQADALKLCWLWSPGKPQWHRRRRCRDGLPHGPTTAPSPWPTPNGKHLQLSGLRPARAGAVVLHSDRLARDCRGRGRGAGADPAMGDGDHDLGDQESRAVVVRSSGGQLGVRSTARRLAASRYRSASHARPLSASSGTAASGASTSTATVRSGPSSSWGGPTSSTSP